MLLIRTYVLAIAGKQRKAYVVYVRMRYSAGNIRNDLHRKWLLARISTLSIPLPPSRTSGEMLHFFCSYRSDGLVGELLKYGGSGMVSMLEQLFSVVWHEEADPRQWREGVFVNLFKKGDREDPGNYRGITLLIVVGKVFCKVLNNSLVQCLDREGVFYKGQAGFRVNRSCMDNVYSLNEIVQGRLREGKRTYAFFLDAYENCVV